MRATAAAADSTRGGGRLRPSARSGGAKLALEAVLIAALLAVAGGLVYHFFVHHVHNPRPLGGRNVDVSRSAGVESQAAVAIDPRDPDVLYVAANDGTLSRSLDGGRSWRHVASPYVPPGSCVHRQPRLAIDAAGRQYFAYLGGRLCDDSLTPFLVVATRPSASARWHVVRVTPPTWEYGYDEGPSLALAPDGTAYVAFDRGLAETKATIEVSRSDDHGRTWTRPVAVSDSLSHPHLASVAAAAGGRVYVAGIDAKLGVWVARSGDGGRTFAPPVRVARLAVDPAAADCSMAAYSPVPHEQERCTGPNPTVLVRGDTVAVLWDDAAANGHTDVFVRLFDANLRPRFRGRANPPDRGHGTNQLFPVAAVDPDTGTFWACWYDTTFSPSGNDAWFTCAASRDGRRWSAPERAAASPSGLDDLYPVLGRSGLYAGIAAAHGVAHPAWIDTSRLDLLEEVFTAALPERRALARAR
ncbi:MAG TPA: sialidase family protein [Gaiellaceae bacterium]|nr:sialidase family protein [Gaiellaceae bacterium]